MARSPLVPVALVLLVAPVTAEYLIGYDDILMRPAALVFGLVFFAPLYGAPALLIRETARRRGLGWPSMLLMATAFGLVQAGLVDQSLFDPDYRAIPYWDSLRGPTFVAPWGTSAYMVLTFVSGHVLGSMAAPIALAESWSTTRGPWLRPRGLVLAALAWAAASAFILFDHLGSTDARITWGQGLGTGAVALLLVLVALRLSPVAPRRGRVPSPWIVLAVTTALLATGSLVQTGWLSTAALAAAFAVALGLLWRWGTRDGWTGRHTVAAVTGDLLSIGVPAFWVEPLGGASLGPKLVTNAALLAIVLAVAARGLVVQRRLPSPLSPERA
ncbi:hypothetical protein ASD11_06635 [Aeromicrobium sp. Root495]|uniref:hypothetical protein n=1 Tax=Aeromicrobium sp. Root495 TaxID=1736550 RepID=UPI0006F6286C|nr:hypothetical protein [Aeromicrobium sp. Root495]KQY59251.1 hypothetical protein ASD11_06635 [Aeromicrobium sp. Root495]